MPQPYRDIHAVSNNDVELEQIRNKVTNLEEQCKELRDMHEVLLEVKFTTREIMEWKRNSEEVINKMSENFIQVSMTLQQISASQQRSVQDIDKLSTDVDSLKNNSKITVRDIVQHIVFVIIGAFITLVFAIIQGGGH